MYRSFLIVIYCTLLYCSTMYSTLKHKMHASPPNCTSVRFTCIQEQGEYYPGRQGHVQVICIQRQGENQSSRCCNACVLPVSSDRVSISLIGNVMCEFYLYPVQGEYKPGRRCHVRVLPVSRVSQFCFKKSFASKRN